ncbi:PTS sugar transporter subunit IIA, partial [Myxococcota bacterium]|nr:PTS sugar transporter subunit IIA [Myxococcota bacterium]
MVSTDFIQPNAIAPILKGQSRDEVLRELSTLLENNYPELASQDVFSLLRAREELSSTAMDGGLAIPHAKVPRLERMYGAFGR